MITTQADTYPRLLAKLRAYWSLTKSLQTGLLIITGLAGLVSARSDHFTWQIALGLIGTLWLAISGSTILNMYCDRDIDACMGRTARRPLPAGILPHPEVLIVGLAISTLGVGSALAMSLPFGLVVFAGLFFDVVIYTIWLKRRTAWSILWGGIAGGMPILAGRVLAIGRIDLIGILLALAVLLWIPTHTLTFGIKHREDYQRAGVPVFANVYGERATRLVIGLSTGLAVIAMIIAMWQIDLRAGIMLTALGLGASLLGIAVASVSLSSPHLNHALFKFASLYMLISMILIIIGATE
jgi:protoheme IX farnesyltransferase